MGYVVTHARKNRAVFSKRNGRTIHSVPAINKSRDISEIMTSQDWLSRRCFIIGGGDSLRGFNYNSLENELTIGVNRAFEVLDSTVNYSMDANFHTWLHNYKPGTEETSRRIQRWQQFRGIRVFLEHPGVDFGANTFLVKRMSERSISLSLKRGIYGGTNSGFGALMLAIALGCKEIYLLGFDMKVAGERTHWHDGYPGQTKERTGKVLNNFTKVFEEFAPHIQRLGINVYNLNPDSALDCFPKLHPSDVLGLTYRPVVPKHGEVSMFSTTGKFPPTFPVFVSFYTKDTGYEDEAKKLADSLSQQGLDYEIVGIADRKNWQLNIRYKPMLIKKMLTRYHPRPVVYIDADAVVLRFPELFGSVLGPIGVHRVHWADYGRDRPDEVLGGTVYVSNCGLAHNILDKWSQECETRSLSVWDQKILQEIIGNDFYNLPPQYCTIFDSMGTVVKDPVILHNQASRRLKYTGRVIRPATRRIKLKR